MSYDNMSNKINIVNFKIGKTDDLMGIFNLLLKEIDNLIYKIKKNQLKMLF